MVVGVPAASKAALRTCQIGGHLKAVPSTASTTFVLVAAGATPRTLQEGAIPFTTTPVLLGVITLRSTVDTVAFVGREVVQEVARTFRSVHLAMRLCTKLLQQILYLIVEDPLGRSPGAISRAENTP